MISKRGLKHLKTPRLAKEIFTNEYIVNRSWRSGKNKVKPQLNLEDKKGYWFLCDYGGWCFIDEGNGVFSCHFGYLPKGLRKTSVKHTKEALEFIKSKGGKLLVGWIALEAKETVNFLNKLNFQMKQRKSGDFWVNDKKTDLGLYNYELCR